MNPNPPNLLKPPAVASTGVLSRLKFAGRARPSGSPDITTASPMRRAGARNSLQFKAVLAVAALALYLAGIGTYALHQRAQQLHTVVQLERNHEQHEVLATANYSLTNAVITVEAALNAAGDVALIEEVRRDVQAIDPRLAAATSAYPSLARHVSRFHAASDALERMRGREALIGLRDAEQELVARIESVMTATETSGYRLSQEYRSRGQQNSTTMVVANLLGIAVFATWVSTFFRRLTRDIKRLEAWAVSVIAGNSPAEALHVGRSDELGAVIGAINHMQSELRIREQKQELLREQRFHQEKMAAIGSLAAAVAHEVNNPIDAICGMAQSTIATLDASGDLNATEARSQAEMTLRQTERIGNIVRQLSDLSAPRSAEPELIDLNALVQKNCAFIQYDRRFRSIQLEVELDPGIAAVFATADHLTQVLMNLMINAADACEQVTGRRALVRVCTRNDQGWVELMVCDNGSGMRSEVLSRAFEEAFTTKPPEKGRGIGLFLCKSLIDRCQGNIQLLSTQDFGTCAIVRLPGASEVPAEVEWHRSTSS